MTPATIIEAQNEAERNQLFIVGLNIDSDKGRYEHTRGRRERVGTGVYVDVRLPPVDRKALLIKNAARIATKLIPGGMLAGSSAFHRGVVEGHLMVASPRGGAPVDVGGVFTIFNTKSELGPGLNREIEFVIADDSFGSLNVKRWADEVLIIKNFLVKGNRPRVTYLNNIDLTKVVERCMRSAGGRDEFLKELAKKANSLGMRNYMRQISTFVDGVGIYEQKETPLKAFRVIWHKTPVATLSHDGHVWSFEYDPNVKLALSVAEKKGKGATPSFLGSLLPEAPRTKDSRYISNITVQPFGTSAEREVIVDVMNGELSSFRDDQLAFRGEVHDDISEVMTDSKLMGSLRRDTTTPRMSGMQLKLAAHLDSNGNLSSARGKPFTHIVKTVGSNAEFQSMCSMEWFSLTVAKACGMNVEEFAIADVGGFGPSLVVERFDIRRDLNDKRMILTEDFWSIEGLLQYNHKYNGELMKVASQTMAHSTDPEKDARHLLAQAAFSWLTWNGDLHLKNLLLVKETKDTSHGFDSIRLSPMYDVMCTEVYPDQLKSSAIALGGNHTHTLAGFRALGKKMGIKSEEVDAMLEMLTVSIPMYSRLVANNLPDLITDHEQSVDHINQAVELFELRCLNMLNELEGSKRFANRSKATNEPDVESFSGESEEIAAIRMSHVEAEIRRNSHWEAANAPVVEPAPRRRRP
jgi:serine/threonine-protein kinase HipA